MILRPFAIINIIVLFTVMSVTAKSKPPTFCGWDPAWDNVYYPIVDQFALVGEDHRSFLNCPHYIFCDYFPNTNAINYNIDEWHNYFKGLFSKEELKQLVYKKSIEWLHGEEKLMNDDKTLFDKISQHQHTFFKRYLLLAKGTEDMGSNTTYDTGWYQGEIARVEDKSPWLDKAFALIKDAPDQFFKNRVGFQIVKLAHYNQDNALAVDAFKRYLKLIKSSSYIYYRALEQVSGAYFNLKQHQIAAQNYLTVFNNLPDRRRNCALSLRFIDWSQLNENTAFYKELKHKDIFHFFKAYYERGDVLKEIEKIAQIDVNSSYLKVLITRLIDDIQSQIFGHSDASYYYEDQQRREDYYYKSIIELMDSILVDSSLNDKSTLILLKALSQIKLGNYREAKETLTKTLDWKASNIHKKRLMFAIDFMNIKSSNRQKINEVYKKLDADKDLNTYKPIVAAFYNHISAIYAEDNPLLSAFIATDYDGYSHSGAFDWSTINNDYAYNYELESRYPFLDLDVINSLDAFIKLGSFTNFEQTILDRLKVDIDDFIHDLRGTYFLGENELTNALKEFEAVKNPSEFWNDAVRPELFSGSIKEWMNVDFNSISDQIHLKYLNKLDLSPIQNTGDEPQMFRENYKDNKVKLTKTLLKLETLANKNRKNTAEYYYMLGNAWYNMSAAGWFVNNLYYIGNDSRNELWSKYSNNAINAPDNAMTWADDYFNKGLESKGDEEIKAKLTFMLAKTNSCYDLSWNDTKNTYDFYLCDDHKEYFNSLRENYSQTEYYKKVLKECSWLRWYNSNY